MNFIHILYTKFYETHNSNLPAPDRIRRPTRSEAEKFGQVQTFIQSYIKNLTFFVPPLCSYHLTVKYIHKASNSNVATMCLLEKV